MRKYLQNRLLALINEKADKWVEINSVGLAEKSLFHFLSLYAIEYLLELSATKHEEWNSFVMRELEQ